MCRTISRYFQRDEILKRKSEIKFYFCLLQLVFYMYISFECSKVLLGLPIDY